METGHQYLKVHVDGHMLRDADVYGCPSCGAAVLELGHELNGDGRDENTVPFGDGVGDLWCSRCFEKIPTFAPKHRCDPELVKARWPAGREPPPDDGDEA